MLGEAATRLCQLAAAAAAEGASYAATLGGDLGTSGLGLPKVEPRLALSWWDGPPPRSSESAPEEPEEVTPPQSSDSEVGDAAPG